MQLALFFAVLTIPFAYGQPKVTREGADWVQTVKGAFPAASVSQLRIASEGSMTVQGQPGVAIITYFLKKRVQAERQADAERLMSEFAAHLRQTGTLATMEFSGPRGAAHDLELFMVVPSRLIESVFHARRGNLKVSGIDGGVEVATSAGALELDRLGSSVLAQTGGGEIQVGEVGGRARCSTGAGSITVRSVGGESWFDTAGGNIAIHSGGGSVHATTGGGNIRVDRSGGAVVAHTGGGIIEILQAAGFVTADTTEGAIQINGARGARCEAGAGPIRLRNVGGGPLHAVTSAGNIWAELLGMAPLQDSLLSTGAGDVLVSLSSNIAVTVQARNVNAGSGRRIVSDFPEIRIQSIGPDGLFESLAQGALHGGGPLLRINASGGIIYLRRVK